MLGTLVLQYLPQYQQYIANTGEHQALTAVSEQPTGLARVGGSSEICIPAKSCPWIGVYTRREVAADEAFIVELACQLKPSITVTPAVAREKKFYVLFSTTDKKMYAYSLTRLLV